MPIDKETLLRLYSLMTRIRKFEEAVRRLRSERKIAGPATTYTGQEAIAAGVCANLGPEDYVGSTHRPLGHAIAKGTELKQLMAELCGKATGHNKGKAGLYHVADPKAGYVGANGIVGASVPIAAGYALAEQIRRTEHIAVSFFGEGASNQGAVQETLNLAAAWDLPIVFVCENSQKKQGLMLGHLINYPQIRISELSTRAAGYGIPGESVDGSDVFSVYESAERAIVRARAGQGPTLLECKAQQYEGPYRGPEADQLEKEWQERDPIRKFRKAVLERGLLSEKDLQLAEDLITERVAEAVEFAISSPEPDLKDAYTDLYAEDER